MVIVTGLAEMKTKVAAMPEKVRKATRAAMEEGAEEVVAMAKRLVRVADGDLRDSIKWTWGDAPQGSLVLAKTPKDTEGYGITIYAGSKKAFYARWLEFGTVKMRRYPFFYPAWRAKRRRVRSRMTRAMKKAILS